MSGEKILLYKISVTHNVCYHLETPLSQLPENQYFKKRVLDSFPKVLDIYFVLSFN